MAYMHITGLHLWGGIRCGGRVALSKLIAGHLAHSAIYVPTTERHVQELYGCVRKHGQSAMEPVGGELPHRGCAGPIEPEMKVGCAGTQGVDRKAEL